MGLLTERNPMSDAIQVIATNKKAFHDYFIEERYEVGLALVGTEVKSLREGGINLKDSFARIEKEEVFLYNCHISPYSHGNMANHDPMRTRKLLLRAVELKRLMGKMQERGLTLVPLSVYFKGSWVKIELALARGKKQYDKREVAAQKSAQREIQHAMKHKQRG
jgi:SsrA-binding protein